MLSFAAVPFYLYVWAFALLPTAVTLVTPPPGVGAAAAAVTSNSANSTTSDGQQWSVCGERTTVTALVLLFLRR